jgi:hypothetical protein
MDLLTILLKPTSALLVLELVVLLLVALLAMLLAKILFAVISGKQRRFVVQVDGIVLLSIESISADDSRHTLQEKEKIEALEESVTRKKDNPT